jgi:hypothetical protein
MSKTIPLNELPRKTEWLRFAVDEPELHMGERLCWRVPVWVMQGA